MGSKMEVKIKWQIKSNEKWNQMRNRLKLEMKSNEKWNQIRNETKSEVKLQWEVKWKEK